jgi:CheY-like chemotaxis protein
MKKDIVILIAEDDSGHFQLIKKNLWLTCVESDIVQFKNGQEVLDFLFKTNSGASLDDTKQYILLLDIRMPKVDGMEVLKKIKGDQTLRKIPVIMLTTTGETDMIKQCYELGCSFYMIKPVNYSHFMEAVQNLGKFLSLEGMRVPFIKSSCA